MMGSKSGDFAQLGFFRMLKVRRLCAAGGTFRNGGVAWQRQMNYNLCILSFKNFKRSNLQFEARNNFNELLGINELPLLLQ